MRGGDLLNRFRELVFELRSGLLPAELNLRVLRQLRCSDLLCDQRPERGDGMPRGQLLHGRIERCGHLPRWHLLWFLGKRMHYLCSGYLPIKCRLGIVCELRGGISVYLDRPRLRCSLPCWELLLGRYGSRGRLPDRIVLVVIVERLLKLRRRHLPSLDRGLGLLELYGRELLRHHWSLSRDWQLRSRELLCCFGEQLHELLEQHVLGLVGL